MKLEAEPRKGGSMKHVLFSPRIFRFGLQTGFTLFCIYAGCRFALFLQWATGASETFVAKPGAVEGFLPISALLGFRQWLDTGQWDMVHPAGLTLFMAFMIMAFLARNGFCGHICPVGFVSSLLERLGKRLGLARALPKVVAVPLSLLRYAALGFFLFTILLGMDSAGVSQFLKGPYNLTADARMLQFFLSPSAFALSVIGALVLLTLMIRNFWCRFLCPYGALLGLIGCFSPMAVTRTPESCAHCSRCTSACPAGIDVEKGITIRSPRCIGCGECVSACPVDGCLSVTLAGRRRVHWMALGGTAVTVLLGFYVWAVTTGHWDVQTPASMLRRIYTLYLGGH